MIQWIILEKSLPRLRRGACLQGRFVVEGLGVGKSRQKSIGFNI